MFRLKPATVERILKIYLFGFFGTLAVTALLLFQPMVQQSGAIRGATLILPPQPCAEAPVPEGYPKQFAPAVPTDDSHSTPAAAEGTAMPSDLPETPLPDAPNESPRPVASIPAGPMKTAAASATAISSQPLLSASSTETRRAPVAARSKSRQVTGDAARARPSARLARRPAIAGTAPPTGNDAAETGCPVDSSPRWSEPDAAGVPVLLCNPYYPRVSVSFF